MSQINFRLDIFLHSMLTYFLHFYTIMQRFKISKKFLTRETENYFPKGLIYYAFVFFSNLNKFQSQAKKSVKGLHTLTMSPEHTHMCSLVLFCLQIVSCIAHNSTFYCLLSTKKIFCIKGYYLSVLSTNLFTSLATSQKIILKIPTKKKTN